jgi:hypothetical protein
VLPFQGSTEATADFVVGEKKAQADMTKA